MTPMPHERGPKGKLSSLPHDSEDLPAVTPDVDGGQIRHFVTNIKSAEQQVGEHIIGALQSPDTVAVLTAVVMDPNGGQRIVSAALDPPLLHEVQQLLLRAERQRTEEVPCVGFHCLLRRRKEAAEAEEEPGKAGND